MLLSAPHAFVNFLLLIDFLSQKEEKREGKKLAEQLPAI
jgi:hypothetical protein